MLEFQQEHALAARLRMCGYFLFFQTGRKAGQRRILVTLLNKNGLTQKELQDILEISSGALSEILHKMEESDLIVRKKGCDDKRQVMLALTDKGQARATDVKEHYFYTIERMFECLSKEEQSQLSGILVKLTDHLDKLKTDPKFEAGCADN
jgi:Transcriptional regulators